MKRLVERELPPQSVEGEAAALLSAVAPHEAAPGMKQRVRARLLTAPVERRRPGFRIVLVLAILAVASLAAAAGAAWLKAQQEIAGRAATPATPPARATAAGPATPPVAPTPTAEEVVPETTAPASEAKAAAPPPASESPSVAPSGANHGAGKAADEVTEANLLFDATRALRHEGNPARAAELLAQYQRKFPRGALAEEALALSIEAASARGDARATTLAKRYLKLYPQGHFVAKAKRALERDGE